MVSLLSGVARVDQLGEQWCACSARSGVARVDQQIFEEMERHGKPSILGSPARITSYSLIAEVPAI